MVYKGRQVKFIKVLSRLISRVIQDTVLKGSPSV